MINRFLSALLFFALEKYVFSKDGAQQFPEPSQRIIEMIKFRPKTDAEIQKEAAAAAAAAADNATPKKLPGAKKLARD